MATIQKRGNNYRIRVSAGYDSTDKQIIKSFTWSPTAGMTAKQIEKELNRVTVEFETRVKSGQYLDGNIKFCDFAEKWLADYAEKQLAPATVVSYRRYLKRTNAAIGHIHLCALQPHHLIEFYNNLAEDNIREDTKCAAVADLNAIFKEHKISRKAFAQENHVSERIICYACQGKNIARTSAAAICKGLELKFSDAFKVTGSGKISDNTILHYHHLICSILTTAVRWQVIFSSPADRVKSPHFDRKEAQCLNEEQAALMVDLLVAEPIQYRTAILLLLLSGMRRGEACGLEWGDVYFTDHVISIARTGQYLPGKGIITKLPKNKCSIRTIKLPVEVFDMLTEYRAWQTSERLKLGDQWQNSNRLFTAWNGAPMNPDTLTQWFEGFIKRHPELPPIHLHNLRHTNASLMIAAGTNVKTVSKRLGHTTTTTTETIYQVAFQSADEKAADAVGSFLKPKAEKA
jgi:integrase